MLVKTIKTDRFSINRHFDGLLMNEAAEALKPNDPIEQWWAHLDRALYNSPLRLEGRHYVESFNEASHFVAAIEGGYSIAFCGGKVCLCKIDVSNYGTLYHTAFRHNLGIKPMLLRLVHWGRLTPLQAQRLIRAVDAVNMEVGCIRLGL